MKRILIVDDEEQIRNILRMYLVKEGYEVSEAEDGEKGLKKYSLDIEQKKVDLRLELEDLEIKTDVKIFNIILNNLLTNALTYMNDEKKLGIYLRDNSLVIENSTDTISDEVIEKIFNPFYKIDSSRNRKYGGTGLGLSIVKNLLEALNLKYSFTYDKDRKFVKFTIIFL